MPDPWGAFPDAPQQGLVINMTKKDDPWSAFPDAQKDDTARTVSRIAGQGAQGANDAIAATIGAIPDIYNRFIGKPFAQFVTGREQNQAGALPTSENLKSAFDYTATAPSRLADMLMQGSAAPLVDSRTSRFDPATRGEKIANKVGEGLGAVASTILPAGLLARAGGVTGGIGEALASQPATQLASGAIGGATTGATDNPWLGLAAGVATPLGVAGAQRAITPVTNRLTDQERNLVNFAQRPVGDPAGGAGMTLTPAQQTGSRGLQLLEETMARTPLAAGPMRGAFENQRGQFNTAVNERAGITANNANPETLTHAFQQQGQTFDDLAARTVVTFDQPAAQRIQQVAQDYGRRLPTDVAPVFQSYMDDLAPYLPHVGPNGQHVPGAQIPGDLYARMRTGITETIRENQANPTLQRALGGLVNSIDDAMERSTTGALRGEWQDARRQYQALMTIDTAMRGGTQEARSRGDIPAAALTNAVRSGDRAGYARGRGQMNELSRLGDYLAPKIPNSGTPERMMVQNLLTGGALFGGGLASGVGIPTAAAAVAAPWTVSRLYNSGLGRAYLTNEVAGDRISLGNAAAQQAVQHAGETDDTKKRRALAQALMRGNEQRVR